jgi:hypothetical protein
MKYIQPDKKLLIEITQALNQVLDSFDSPDIDAMELLIHQLEAVTLVLGAMVVEADLPLRITQQALARIHANAMDRRHLDDDEQIH